MVESEAILYESLRRLQWMQLSIEALKATQIGRAVNGLRKHNSKRIRTLVRSLIDGWKLVVDKWFEAAAAIDNVPPEPSHDFVNPTAMDAEVGLPCPPMDGGAQLAIHNTTIHFSEFCDGIDVDENYNVSRNHNKMIDTPQAASESFNPLRQLKSLQKEKPQGIANKPIKLSTVDSGPCRPLKLDSKQKPIILFSGVQRKPLNTLQEKSMDYGDELYVEKLEIAKWKLREGYQQAEQAKKQRTIKILELHELPKELEEPEANSKKKDLKRKAKELHVLPEEPKAKPKKKSKKMKSKELHGLPEDPKSMPKKHSSKPINFRN